MQWDSLLRWSANGKSVTYIDHHGGVDNLWAQSIDKGTPKKITDFKENEIFSFDWLRDGRLVTSRGVITRDVLLPADAR